MKKENLFAEHNYGYEEIKIQAQKDGTWIYLGLDANEHLFKVLRKEMLQCAQEIMKKFEEEQE